MQKIIWILRIIKSELYNEYANWLKETDYDFEIAGAKLLGIDIAEISFKETNRQVLSFFENQKGLETFAYAIWVVEGTIEDNSDRVMLILKAVEKGLKENVN